MLLNEKNVRDNAEYLANEYGIAFAPEYDKNYPWWIPDAAANTTEDYEYLVDFKPFKTSLRVSPGDEIVLTSLAKTARDGYLFAMDNITNGESVFVKYSPKCICGLYDDDRYEIIMRLASGLKDVPNVTIQYFLLYSDELVLNYVGAIEDDII